ncbi:MAG: hypothetical protein II495_04545, partial [Paludibacteraceae bacterium]|nr:hypothetical protein [Paludibacteraceae bacterium]
SNVPLDKVNTAKAEVLPNFAPSLLLSQVTPVTATEPSVAAVISDEVGVQLNISVADAPTDVSNPMAKIDNFSNVFFISVKFIWLIINLLNFLFV